MPPPNLAQCQLKLSQQCQIRCVTSPGCGFEVTEERSEEIFGRCEGWSERPVSNKFLFATDKFSQFVAASNTYLILETKASRISPSANWTIFGKSVSFACLVPACF